jgi:hypothetical protein
LRAFDIPIDQALAFAILLHAVVTLPVLIGGGVILLTSGRHRKISSSDAKGGMAKRRLQGTSLVDALIRERREEASRE